MPWAWALPMSCPALLCSTRQVPGQKRSMKPHEPESFLTGSSKAARVRRFLPKTSKNSFQKVWRRDFSEVSPFQSRAKAMARCLISFHESGMAGALARREQDNNRPV